MKGPIYIHQNPTAVVTRHLTTPIWCHELSDSFLTLHIFFCIQTGIKGMFFSFPINWWNTFPISRFPLVLIMKVCECFRLMSWDFMSSLYRRLLPVSMICQVCRTCQLPLILKKIPKNKPIFPCSDYKFENLPDCGDFFPYYVQLMFNVILNSSLIAKCKC